MQAELTPLDGAKAIGMPFTDKPVTAFGGLALFVAFAQRIGLAEKLRARKVGADGFFSCREVYLKGWSGLDSPEAVKLAAEVLEDAGWVRSLAGETGPLGSRPSNRYEINPRVWEKP